MRMYDVIYKKKQGEALTKEEIRFFVEGYVRGEIPDYQASALLMAIAIRGMNADETAELTFAVRDSGARLDFSDIKGLKVDKHSTGGVGDKTSLIVAPLVASLGLTVAKMSGRGLGHTGGTIDKLESIPHFNTSLSKEDFVSVVNEVGVAIVGQSAILAPADKKLYALRDVTATVDSLPLIVSSIMGKKLAVGDDCILLDVKTGSGALAKTLEDSKALASAMVDIGKRAGKKMCAVITNMDVPLGCAIGNSLEVIEAVETLKGRGPKDLEELCLQLSARILMLAKGLGLKESYESCRKSLLCGDALNVFARMVEAQGGDKSYVLDPTKFERAKYSREIYAKEEGYISFVNTEGYGKASLQLGAGRNTKEDEIDNTAGIILKKKTGDSVKKGDCIAVLYTSKSERLDEAERIFVESTTISTTAPQKQPLIYAEIR